MILSLSQTSIFNSIRYKRFVLSILQMMHYFRPSRNHTHSLSGLKKKRRRRRSDSRFYLFPLSCSAFLSASWCSPELCDQSLCFADNTNAHEPQGRKKENVFHGALCLKSTHSAVLVYAYLILSYI